MGICSCEEESKRKWVKKQAYLLRLQHFGRWDINELGAEDAVPETTGDAKTVFVIGKMVLQVVFLELFVVQG